MHDWPRPRPVTDAPEEPPPQDTLTIPRAVIDLRNGQLKSLEAGRQVAAGIGLIEAAWGIHSVEVRLAGCFICCDVDWRELDRTPNELLLRDLIMHIEAAKVRINRPPWTPPFWYVEPDRPNRENEAAPEGAAE